MIQIFKTSEDEKLEKIKDIENNSWIHLTNPTTKEVEEICAELNIEAEVLLDVLDPETQSIVDKDADITSVVIDIPHLERNDESELYSTIPLGIFVIRDEFIITISTKENNIFADFRNGKVKTFATYKKSRFIIQLLYRISLYYLKCLKFINKETDRVEMLLYKSPRNKDLFRLLAIEKSLVYFKTSIKANQIILEKLLKGNIIKLYEEDEDMLDDAIIENKQAIEMTEIYSNIVRVLMTAFGSIISNNLNLLMKFLTGITIVLSIPTMVASFMGMNVDLGLFTTYRWAFFIVSGIAVLLSLIVFIILKKKDML